ncbi:unnamed protein product [Moneuplotes crassus]|uniref:Uncharacterized protein n=1 Tax=Euplotes crassus TaxID=5936 RepID=A0AAD2D9E1_EUPCR|nr:unnamed protein product [Moneuplotes crassus]
MANKILTGVSKYMLSTVKGVDMYPKTITFTFKGQEEFKTLFGGIISLIIKIVILLYTYQMISIMITNKNSSKNVNTTVQNILNDTDPINLTGTKFQFAVRATIDGIDFDMFNEPSYGTASITQLLVIHLRIFVGVINQVPVGVSRCGNNFRYDNQQEIDYLKLSEFYCPDSRNFSVLGNIHSETLSFFSFSVARQEYSIISRCNNATSSVTCQTNSTIDSIMTKIQIRLYVVNTYFDFEDYENPIKTYLDDRFLFYLMPGFSQNIGVRLQKNEAEIQDNYLAFAPGGNVKEFIGFDTIMDRTATEGNPDESLLSISFTKDSSSKSYERSVFTVLEAFGNVGGLLEIFSIAGGLIVGLFAERLFFYTIFSKMYQVEEPKDEQEERRNYSRRMVNAQDEEEEHKGIDNDQYHSETPKEELANQAKEAINRRTKYGWKFTDLLYNILMKCIINPFTICCKKKADNSSGCLKCLFCCCINRRNKLNLMKRVEYYSKGEDKYAHEFDAVKFSKNMRHLETIVASLLDDSEKFVITHQKSNVLALDDSDSNSDHEEIQQPKLFDGEAKKNLYRVKVKRFMDKYMNEEWTERDYQLCSGIFSKNSLKNSKIQAMMSAPPSNRPLLPTNLPDTPTNLPPEESKHLSQPPKPAPQLFISRASMHSVHSPKSKISSAEYP